MRQARRHLGYDGSVTIVVFISIVLACGACVQAEPGTKTTTQDVSAYGNCRGGCPDGMRCVGYYDQGYCLPECDAHDDCASGCCARTQSGARSCAPVSSCHGTCRWSSRVSCLTLTAVRGAACNSETSLVLTVVNDCPVAVRAYSCITASGATWDCRTDQQPGGLQPGASYVHSLCNSGGNALVWGTDYATFEQNDCPVPLP